VHPSPTIPQAPLSTAFTRRRLLRRSAAVAGAILFGLVLSRQAGAHDRRATCVAIAQDGRALTSDDWGRLIAWDINGAAPKPVVFAQVHKRKAAYVATFKDVILTAGYDGDVFIHSLQDPNLIIRPFTGHRGGKREVWVAIVAPDGKHALSGADDGQILYWDLPDPTKPEINPNNPDTIRTFPYQDKKKEKKNNARGPVAGLAFLPRLPSPENATKLRFLSTHGFGDVHLWEFDTANKNDPPAILHTFYQGNRRAVNAVAVLNGGAEFLSAGFDDTLRRWNVDAKQSLQQFAEHKDWIWRIALSKDSNLAATASDDGTVRVWDVKNRSPNSVHKFTIGGHGSMGVAFTNDGRVVYTLDGEAAEAAAKQKQIAGLVNVEKLPEGLGK
jgi:WD40 repeat protein